MMWPAARPLRPRLKILCHKHSDGLLPCGYPAESKPGRLIALELIVLVKFLAFHGGAVVFEQVFVEFVGRSNTGFIDPGLSGNGRRRFVVGTTTTPATRTASFWAGLTLRLLLAADFLDCDFLDNAPFGRGDGGYEVGIVVRRRRSPLGRLAAFRIATARPASPAPATGPFFLDFVGFDAFGRGDCRRLCVGRFQQIERFLEIERFVVEIWRVFRAGRRGGIRPIPLDGLLLRLAGLLLWLAGLLLWLTRRLFWLANLSLRLASRPLRPGFCHNSSRRRGCRSRFFHRRRWKAKLPGQGVPACR